jgi:PAS domain S-box-containing protein
LLQKHDKKLKESLNRYMGLFQDNPNSMWIYDSVTLRFLAVNDAALEKYGYDRGEFLTMNIHDISVDGQRMNEISTTVSESKMFFDSGIWKLKKKDGTSLYVRQLSHSLMYKNRKCNLTLTEDLTGIIQQGIKLRNIAFKNSHEVRKPVANIIGLTGLIDRTNLNESNIEIINYIEKSIQELDEVIKSIADESSAENK